MSTILYIEDDPHLRLMLGKHLLTAKGYLVETARDGVQGVKRARELRPDLILLDLYMPRMDGLSVIIRLKADPLTSDIPIIVISALPTNHNRQLVQEAGAQGFVAKPFRPNELLDLVRENLSQSARSR